MHKFGKKVLLYVPVYYSSFGADVTLGTFGRVSQKYEDELENLDNP